MISIIY